MSVNIVSNFLNEIGLKDPVPCCSLSNANLYTEALALFNSRFTWALVSFFLGIIFPPCKLLCKSQYYSGPLYMIEI